MGHTKRKRIFNELKQKGYLKVYKKGYDWFYEICELPLSMEEYLEPSIKPYSETVSELPTEMVDAKMVDTETVAYSNTNIISNTNNYTKTKEVITVEQSSTGLTSFNSKENNTVKHNTCSMDYNELSCFRETKSDLDQTELKNGQKSTISHVSENYTEIKQMISDGKQSRREQNAQRRHQDINNMEIGAELKQALHNYVSFSEEMGICLSYPTFQERLGELKDLYSDEKQQVICVKEAISRNDQYFKKIGYRSKQTAHNKAKHQQKTFDMSKIHIRRDENGNILGCV